MSHQQVNKGKGKAAMPGSKANPLIRNVFGTTPMSSTSSSTIGPGTPPDEAMFAAVQDDDDKAGGGGMGKKGLKRTRSLFNLKNASTDNMSIASAASSASMMIRKIGAFGKLASRNSISGISNIFKDKKSKDTDDVDGHVPKKKKFRSRKSPPTTPSVTRYNAELDREAGGGSTGEAGLTPAAQLARQHTIKSKAADAARQQQQEDDRRRQRSVSATVSSSSSTTSMVPTEDGRKPSLELPTAWEKNSRIKSHGRPTSSDTGGMADDEGFAETSDEADDTFSVDMEDVTSRLENVDVHGDESDEYAEWGSQPVVAPSDPPSGILKTQPSAITPLGPNWSNMAMMINSPSFTNSPTSPYQQPSHNSSAPTLSFFNAPVAPVNLRSTTAPPGKRKEIVWAPNCAVYHTFHQSEYDRRSEPATCNRLTPALAQEIKAFLNHYKLEEMDVHPSSRVYTHFFP